jgi:hypothetical protein
MTFVNDDDDDENAKVSQAGYSIDTSQPKFVCVSFQPVPCHKHTTSLTRIFGPQRDEIGGGWRIS